MPIIKSKICSIKSSKIEHKTKPAIKVIGDREQIKNFAQFLESREKFLERLSMAESILEIGPFDKPLLSGSKIRYLEILPREELVARAKEIPGRIPENIPEIHYYGAEGVSVATNGEKFEVLISSHLIEHQPDFIGHIRDVIDSLENCGTYYAIIPNKSKCFDFFIPESNIIDVVSAHLEQRTKPTARSVIEHRAFTRHNFQQIECDNPITNFSLETFLRAEEAFKEWKTTNYVDVHCWYFTAENLYDIVLMLMKAQLIPNIGTVCVLEREDEIELYITKV